MSTQVVPQGEKKREWRTKDKVAVTILALMFLHFIGFEGLAYLGGISLALYLPVKFYLVYKNKRKNQEWTVGKNLR